MPIVLKFGDSGDAVADVRRRLESLGFATEVDSRAAFGEATCQAVVHFQESRGLRVDGICGPQTWAALVEAGYRLGNRLIYLHKPMLRGDDVAELQRRLGGLGFDTGRVDGIFGTDTETALIQFQHNMGLVADGIFGRASLDALLRVCSRSDSSSIVAEVKEREVLRSGARTLVDRRITVAQGGELGTLTREVTRLLRNVGAVVVEIDDPDGSRQARAANSAASSVHLSLATRLDGEENAASFYSGFRYESPGGRRLAESLVAHLTGVVGTFPHGITGMSLPVLRETRMPAVVCEIGPPVVVTNNVDTLARAVVDALAEWAAETWE